MNPKKQYFRYAAIKNRTTAYVVALLLAMVITVGEAMAEMPAPTSNRNAAPKGAATTKAAASNYVWNTPVTGMPKIPVWTRGQTYNLTWTGGPVGPVKLYLINWCTWTTQIVIVASKPNTHSHVWTVPTTLPCGVYECYIQNAVGPPTNWSYSMNFAITK